MHNFHVLEMTSLTWIIQNYVNNSSFKWIWQIIFYEITIFLTISTLKIFSRHLISLVSRAYESLVVEFRSLAYHHWSTWPRVPSCQKGCLRSRDGTEPILHRKCNGLDFYWVHCLDLMVTSRANSWIKIFKNLGHGTLVTQVGHSYAP